jgi:predicted phosphodiesterase
MLGAISNSIGRAESVAAAVQMLRSGGATYVIHLGDIGGRHVLDALGGPLGVACGFVWGDRDRDRMGLMRYGNSVGVECLGLISDFEYEGQRVVAIHGEDRKAPRRLSTSNNTTSSWWGMRCRSRITRLEKPES